MHVDTLTYFRTKKPEDISTLTQHFPMVGPNELKATYPKFMYNKDQDLVFHYRDGGAEMEMKFTTYIPLKTNPGQGCLMFLSPMAKVL